MLTISGAVYDQPLITLPVGGNVKGTYHYSLSQGGASQGYVIDAPLMLAESASGYESCYDPILVSPDTIKIPQATSLGRTYFFALDLDSLSFSERKVTSISLPVMFAVQLSNSGISGSENGGYICRLTVDGVEVGNYFDMSLDSTGVIFTSRSVTGSVVGVTGMSVYTATINYTFPSPTDTANIGIHVIRRENNARPYIFPAFALGFGDLYYEYVSSTTVDVIPPEQQEALGDMSKDFADKESQAQEILGDMNVPQIDYVPPELSFENESLVAGALSDVLDAVPSLKVLLGVGLSLTVLAVILYGVRGL